jgi:hypothetical protein
MDLWQMVMADQANIMELCREVLRATGHGPNSRAELFADLEDEVERHLAAKETVLYPALAGHERTQTYMSELEPANEEIRRHLDDLAGRQDVNSADWAADFRELESALRRAFTLEQNGVMIVGRGVLTPHEMQGLMRAYEREQISSYQSNRWHLPQSVMPSRYGLPTGMTFGLLAGAAALGAAALLWRSSKPMRSNAPLRPARRRPEAPFPLQSGNVDNRLSQGRSTTQWTPRRDMGHEGEAAGSRASATDRTGNSPMTSGAAAAGAASTTGGASATGGGSPAGSASTTGSASTAGSSSAAAGSSFDAGSSSSGGSSSGGGQPSPNKGFSSANPPHAPSGIATPLQPGGTTPGGGPGASAGSVGTGGAQTGNSDTGSVKRDGQ